MADEVSVKLTAEGLNEVVAAFRKVADEAEKAGKKTGGVFKQLDGVLKGFGVSLASVSTAGVVAGLAAVGKTGLKLADDMGKMAQKTGSATEGLSVLAAAAELADVETKSLQTGLVKLAKSTFDLENGNKDLQATYAALGLSAKDFAGKTTDQSFALVAQRLGKIEDGSKKTAIAMELFGKSGAELIPLLNQVADEGIGPLTEAARESGLVIDQATADAADAVNDSFTKIGQQSKGLAIQFASGFAPAVLQAMESFTDSVKGGGDQVKKFGQFVGKVVGFVVNAFVTMKNVIGSVFKTIGDLVGGLFATLSQLVRGNFEEAGEIFKQTFIDAFDTVTDGAKQFQQDLGKTLFDALEDPPEVKITPKVDKQALDDFETATEKADRERAEKEAQRAIDLAKRKAEAEEREQSRLASQRAGYDAKLLEAQGKRHEAALRQLDEEARKLDDILKKQGVADANRLQAVNEYRTVLKGQIDAQAALDEAQRVTDALARDRVAIENQVALGTLSQVDAQRKLAEIELQRLVTLQQLAQAALAAAQATGDPEAIARAQQLNLEVQSLGVSIKKASDNFSAYKEAAADSIGGSVVGLFDAAIRQQESFGDAAKAAALSVVDSIRQIAAELLKQQIVKYLSSLFGAAGSAGSTVGSLAAATGGYVSGPGTGTSDSIPARLSDGEFVVRASVVNQPGVLQHLARLNRGGARRVAKPGTQRFASGGLVSSQEAPQGQGGGVTVKNVNVMDPSMVTDAISSPAGERTTLNVIKRNIGSLRKLFGG